MSPSTIIAIARLVQDDPIASRNDQYALAKLLSLDAPVYPQVVSMTKAAQMLNVTPQCLTVWVREGKLQKRKEPWARDGRGLLLSDVERVVTNKQ